MTFDIFVIEKVDSQRLNDKLQSWQVHQNIGNLILTGHYGYASLLGPPRTLENHRFSLVIPGSSRHVKGLPTAFPRASRGPFMLKRRPEDFTRKLLLAIATPSD